MKALALQVATAFLEGVKLEQLPADRLAAVRDSFVGAWQCFSDVSGVVTSTLSCNSYGQSLFTEAHDLVRTSGNALDGLQCSHVHARLHDDMQNSVKTVTGTTATEDMWFVQGKIFRSALCLQPKSFAQSSWQ